MKRTRYSYTGTMLATVGLLVASTISCMDYTLFPIDGKTPPPVDCTALCEEQNPALVPASCTYACGVNAGSGYTADSNTAVLDFGQSCQLVVDCPDGTPCDQAVALCVTESGNVYDCTTQYADCALALTCDSQLTSCQNDAEAAYEACLAAGSDQCDSDYTQALHNCDCDHDACLGTVDTECGLSLFAPPPSQTGAHEWTVTRRFINAQLARRTALDTETGEWRVVDRAAHAWAGVRLTSIDPKEPLYLLGLRNHDLLVAINGTPIITGLGNPADLLALRNTSDIAVGIKRAGVAMVLHYHLVP